MNKLKRQQMYSLPKMLLSKVSIAIYLLGIALIDLLQLCNYQVVACETGIQARDELLKTENEFDLILLDLGLPEMTGLELLQIIKAIDKLKDVPVIMMSGDDETETVAACLNAGAEDYM
ncbi:unnamed protein product [Paramecium pentaurelia]|uniref:Response regulatory domain-containing protein n=1 Tax=Paramecium pentaurelia TaxID=43138 RepID=A0A8S1TNM5_9CILI|nr:unnamed protein product [Paramecium pentaurelia]